VAAAVLLVELVVAWFTGGTPDVTIFRSFAQTVSRVGPIEIYSLDVDAAGLMVYNHPPLIGWWLTVVNAGTSIGLPFPFMIRLPSIAGHAVTTILIYELLRVRVQPRVALLSAICVAVSPVLLIISGFHGNNDPAMTALLIASVWLLVDRRSPALAGAAFALAVSIKIVPVVALPILLVAAWRLGRRDVVRFLLGAVPVAVLLWLPVLLLAGKGFFAHVLGYNGSGFPRQWGPYKIAEVLHLPSRLLDLYAGPGTYLVLLLAAVVPAWLIRNTPHRAPAALALCLTTFLVISPAWAPQYTSWVAAVVFLLELRSAIAFTVLAGGVYLILYTQWAGYRVWDYAEVTTLTSNQMRILVIAWIALVPCLVLGLRMLLRADGASPLTDAGTSASSLGTVQDRPA
jgi:uncharacterized membrane protein